MRGEPELAVFVWREAVASAERAGEVGAVCEAVAFTEMSNRQVRISGIGEVAVAALKSPGKNPSAEACAAIGE